jgi:hypothetical protein
MVNRKSIKTKMGGGATRNGVPVASSTTPVKEETELDEEQLDEISAKTLSSYASKAAKEKSGKRMEGMKKAAGKIYSKQSGIDKMSGYHKEETELDEEQLDELSKDTVDSYHKKVGDDINWRRADMERAQRKGDTETAKKEYSKLRVRKKGEKRAMDRLTK